MTIRIALCTIVFAVCFRAAAQEPVLPRSEDAASPAAAVSPTPVAIPPQLIPDDVLPLPKPTASAADLQQLDQAFADKPLTPLAADYRLRIEWRKLRNFAVNDPAVKGAWKTAEAAKTDLQKRKLMRSYYELLFQKMLARAATPELKAYLTARKNEELAMLPQPHVRPQSSPLPTPTATPAAARLASPPPPPALPAPETSPTPDASPAPSPTPPLL